MTTTKRRPKTTRKNFRLSDSAKDFLAKGAELLGITETNFVELAVREKFVAVREKFARENIK